MNEAVHEHQHEMHRARLADLDKHKVLNLGNKIAKQIDPKKNRGSSSAAKSMGRGIGENLKKVLE